MLLFPFAFHYVSGHIYILIYPRPLVLPFASSASASASAFTFTFALSDFVAGYNRCNLGCVLSAKQIMIVMYVITVYYIEGKASCCAQYLGVVFSSDWLMWMLALLTPYTARFHSGQWHLAKNDKLKGIHISLKLYLYLQCQCNQYYHVLKLKQSQSPTQHYS